MYKAYKFRMYPTKKQEILINKTIGCTRFIYNHFLSECKKNGYIKAYAMCKEIKELEKEYPWLREVDGTSLRCSVFNFEDPYNYRFNDFDQAVTYLKQCDAVSVAENMIENSAETNHMIIEELLGDKKKIGENKEKVITNKRQYHDRSGSL